MTEPSEAAKAKAREIINGSRYQIGYDLAQYIQQVSDAVKLVYESESGQHRRTFLRPHLDPFILPEPVDPLAEALRALDATTDSYESEAVIIRKELAKRGFKIVKDDT